MLKPCPRCGSALAEETFGSIRLDGCGACGGLWFDYQELNRLAHDPAVAMAEVERAFEGGFSAGVGQGDMQCPNCVEALYPFAFPHTPNVRLDACRKCKGIWVDDGELHAIEERIEAAKPRAVESAGPGLGASDARCNRVSTLSALSEVSYDQPGRQPVLRRMRTPLKVRSFSRLCPFCCDPLHPAFTETSNVSVDTCAACGGVWFEEGELPVFLRLGPEAIRSVQSVVHNGGSGRTKSLTPAARCPGCYYSMQRINLSGEDSILIDVCPNCQSVWLDAGELPVAYDLLVRDGSLALGSSADPWRS